MSPPKGSPATLQRWFIRPAPTQAAPLRLFCLPYAGGTASIYNRWPVQLSGIDVVTVELPGHGTRLSEPLHSEMPLLIRALADAIEPELTKPYAVFGHSLGARIAFELVRTIRRRALPAPLALFVSGCRAPHIPRVPTPPLASLPDQAFTSMVQQMSGTPPEIFEEPELLDLLIPVLRADFNLVDTYEYTEEPALPWPVHAFGGTSDPEAPEDALLAWQVHTSSSFSLRRFAGGHFVVRTRQGELTAAIGADLARLLPLGPA